tara:strand:+ start:240 stop:365 length:126 start_codon:yes stop_codon:yes gene_type:complete
MLSGGGKGLNDYYNNVLFLLPDEVKDHSAESLSSHGNKGIL